jgi:nucleotide-binding universal stress UspA family protein
MVGYRRDRHGDDALGLARTLASSAPVEAVHVVEVLRGEPGRDEEQRLAAAKEGWPDRVRVTAQATADGSPADALASLADAEGADLVVLGPTHRGFAGRILHGTTAGDLLTGIVRPVAIAPSRPRAAAALQTIGVAIDGSQTSRAALDWAAGLAASCSALLRVIGVVEPPPPPVETWGGGVPGEAWTTGLTYTQDAEIVQLGRERVEALLEGAAAEAGWERTETLTMVGDTAAELDRAAEDLDMLVVGSHGRGGLERAMLGSVSRALAHSCAAPLVVVPPHGARPADEPVEGASAKRAS